MYSFFAFFLLICVLVFVHEYGHFWAARKCGVKVLRFSIGFGKVLWRRTDKHGTEFAFSLIPLGGYVQMSQSEAGEVNVKNDALNQKSVLQRAFIVAAGPIANFLFAILAYWAVFMAGVPTVKPVVGNVLPQTIAAQAGIEPEFQFKQIDGRTVHDWEEVSLALIGKVGEQAVKIEGIFANSDVPVEATLDLSGWDIQAREIDPLTSLGIRPKSGYVEPMIKSVVEGSSAALGGLLPKDKMVRVNGEPFDWQKLVETVRAGQVLNLEIERGGELKMFTLQPQKNSAGQYLVGIEPEFQPLAEKYRTVLQYDVLSAFSKSLEKVFGLVGDIFRFIGKLLTGDLALSNMGGPLSIAKGAGATAQSGLVYYLGFMALISVNLGVMNLFPILPLDGGQLVLLAVEKLRGKPLSQKWQFGFQKIGIVLVLWLMAFVLLNDVLSF